MGYYDGLENIQEYTRASGSLRSFLINALEEYLYPKTSILELGMGPGNDFTYLSNHFLATGSDKSDTFLSNYQKEHEQADLLLIDAANINISRTFDVIYSNKVLHHLYREELKSSINQQTEILNDEGLVAHSFWAGNREEDYLDLHFVYYKISEIRALFDPYFTILHLEEYCEKSPNDSIYIIGKKR